MEHDEPGIGLMPGFLIDWCEAFTARTASAVWHERE
jgi:hypothetical protein